MHLYKEVWVPTHPGKIFSKRTQLLAIYCRPTYEGWNTEERSRRGVQPCGTGGLSSLDGGRGRRGRLRQEVKFIEKQNTDQFLEEVGTTNTEEHMKKKIDGREIQRTQMAIPPAFSWSPGQTGISTV